MKLKELLLPAILFAIPAVSLNAQTNIFPPSGNVGIGTTSPSTLLEAKKGIDMGNTGTQFVAPYYIGTCNDFGSGGADQYLILTPYVTQASANPSAGLSGKLTGYRGNTTTGNVVIEYEVLTQTAWSQTGADIIPIASWSNAVNIYKVDYNGVSYIAVHVPDLIATAQSSVSLNFQGFYWNNINSQKPQLVPTSALTNITVVRDFQPIYGKLMWATSAGNIAIGTTNTKGYKLAVNGSAVFTKAVVKSYANWPDYVFDKDYTLMTLDSVEAFIHAKGHLPEIASAAEVSKTGIDLGDNQTKLLQKVEELTLYLINQNKINTEQKALLEQQNAKMASLQTVVENLKTQMDRLKGNK